MSLAARRLRILILRQGYYPDDPRVRREVEALAARGHAVDLVCLRGPGQPARETLAGARVYRLPLARRRAGRLRYLWDYLAFFVAASLAVGLLSARRRYPLVQVNSLPDFLVWAAWPARLTGARVLLDLHELMPELFASKYATGMDHPLPRLLGRIETAAIRWSDASLAVSQPCLERYLARGAPAERFTFRRRRSPWASQRLIPIRASCRHRPRHRPCRSGARQRRRRSRSCRCRRW